MENQTVHVERYTLTTALCMIVGICIGSGIFFKSDNILIATGGNVALGVAMFLLAATTIVFGGLTLARFASRTDGAGGPIAYAERFLGPHRLTFVGWHFTFLYLPMVTAIICWVVGVYACMTFGLAGSFAHVAKVAPLVVVLAVGLIFGQPAQHIVHGIETAGAAGTGWIAAAAPIAFAFDGWSAAASIAPELKNAKRNLPLALTIGPAIILVLYVGYFLGVSCTLGPQTVMAAGDASLSMLFVELFGEGAATLPNLIALIAVVGTANGLVLSLLRMPYALALHDEIPCSKAVLRMNKTLKFPLVSAAVALGTTLFWMAVHAVVTTFNLLPNGDISEVSVSLTLLVLPLFYVQALIHDPAGPAPNRAARIRRAIAPVIAIASSLAVGLSSISNPTRWPFVAAHIITLGIATYLMGRRRARKA